MLYCVLFRTDLSDDISIDKSLITVYAGSDATFICTPPSAEPLPAIRWESNGIVLTRNQHVYLSRDNTVLRLTALTLADSGIYYCIAENGLGISVNASTELRTCKRSKVVPTHTRTRLLFSILYILLSVKLVNLDFQVQFNAVSLVFHLSACSLYPLSTHTHLSYCHPVASQLLPPLQYYHQVVDSIQSKSHMISFVQRQDALCPLTA